MKVNGSFRYLGPDGLFYEVRYTADDQGFHPEGDHFKVPPYVPWIHRHGHHAEGDSNTPTYTNNRDTFNTIGSTPTPSTPLIPKYTSVETKENLYSTAYPPLYSEFRSTTSKPTTMYLPLESRLGNDHVTEESKVNFHRPRPTVQYLPTASSSPLESFTFRSVYPDTSRNPEPDPEIILFSTPPGQRN